MSTTLNKPDRTGVLILSAMAAGSILLGVLALRGCDRPPSPPDKEDAEVMARLFVKELLKSPSSAKFGDIKVTELSNEQFTVQGWVEAQDELGAVLRSRFEVKLKHEKGKPHMEGWSMVGEPKVD